MSGLVRIIIHWTAGDWVASALDKEHYHFLYERNLRVVAGDLPPEENIRTNDGIYGAHTRALNTGSIGVAFCGMLNAQSSPLVWGPRPLAMEQIDFGCRHIAGLARKYGIPVTRTTILTHAEVQPTLGVMQRGKWDIRCLPGDKKIRPAVEVGDILREKIAA